MFPSRSCRGNAEFRASGQHPYTLRPNGQHSSGVLNLWGPWSPPVPLLCPSNWILSEGTGWWRPCSQQSRGYENNTKDETKAARVVIIDYTSFDDFGLSEAAARRGASGLGAPPPPPFSLCVTFLRVSSASASRPLSRGRRIMAGVLIGAAAGKVSIVWTGSGLR